MFVWTSGDRNDGRFPLWNEDEWRRLRGRMHRIYRIRIAKRRAVNIAVEWWRFLAPLAGPVILLLALSLVCLLALASEYGR